MESLKKSDPKFIGPWKLLSRLGSGGMSVVYYASNKDTSFSALKVIRSQYLENRNDRSRIEREIETLSNIKSKFVCEIIDSEINDEIAWIATEYIDGPDLSEKILADGLFKELEWLNLAKNLSQGLSDIHKFGVIHRDIKPTNILISKDGPKFIDFGISQTSESTSLTSTGLIAGSPAWLSPEQITGKKISFATDIFSLGVLLNFAARGTSPWGDYTKTTRDVIYNKILQNHPETDGLNKFQKEFLNKILLKNPNSRITANDMKSEIQIELNRIYEQEKLILKQKKLEEQRLQQLNIKKEDEKRLKQQRSITKTNNNDLTSTTIFRPNISTIKNNKNSLILVGISSVIVLMIITFSFLKLFRNNDNLEASPTTLQAITPTPSNSIENTEEFSKTTSPSPSPEVKSSENSPNPTPTQNKNVATTSQIQICRTINQFGSTKQCFKQNEITEIVVSNLYNDCPWYAFNLGCDIGSKVIVPINRDSVILPCVAYGDYLVRTGNIGVTVGGGGIRKSDYCIEKSNGTLPYSLNGYIPLAFFDPKNNPDGFSIIPDLGIEVDDEYIVTKVKQVKQNIESNVKTNKGEGIQICRTIIEMQSTSSGVEQVNVQKCWYQNQKPKIGPCLEESRDYFARGDLIKNGQVIETLNISYSHAGKDKTLKCQVLPLPFTQGTPMVEGYRALDFPDILFNQANNVDSINWTLSGGINSYVTDTFN